MAYPEHMAYLENAAIANNGNVPRYFCQPLVISGGPTKMDRGICGLLCSWDGLAHASLILGIKEVKLSLLQIALCHAGLVWVGRANENILWQGYYSTIPPYAPFDA